MLNDVSLTEFMWPCLDYALRRVGYGSVRTKENLELNFGTWLIPDDLSEIPEGAILFWENAEGEKSWLLTIKDKIVFETYTFNRGHYAVYEGDGLISDLGWHDDSPYIRFRKLGERSRPDKMFIL